MQPFHPTIASERSLALWKTALLLMKIGLPVASAQLKTTRATYGLHPPKWEWCCELDVRIP